MGSEKHYSEEKPSGPASVDGFWMDETAVTNRQFARFVAETGYVTTAEKAPDPAMYPGADPAMLVPGSITFSKPNGPVDLSNPMAWWAWTPGAEWRHPWGPATTLEGKEDHPVTQVTFEDADAYARWAGKELPTEVQWERAGRGGIEGAEFAWGDELPPGGEESDEPLDRRFPPGSSGQPEGGPRKPGTVAVRSFDRTRSGSSRSPGTPGNGRRPGFPRVIPSRPAVAARQPIRSAPVSKPAGIRPVASPGRCSRADPSSVPRTTVQGIGLPRGSRRASRVRPSTSPSAAWSRSPGRPGRVKPVRSPVQAPAANMKTEEIYV